MVAHNFASKFGINVRSPRPNLWPKKFYSIYLRRAHKEELKQALANENFDGQRTFNEAVLKSFVDLHDFTDLILVQALRQFLWSFRYGLVALMFFAH